jgi:hypothetical protein
MQQKGAFSVCGGRSNGVSAFRCYTLEQGDGAKGGNIAKNCFFFVQFSSFEREAAVKSRQKKNSFLTILTIRHFTQKFS